jgi:RES domain
VPASPDDLAKLVKTVTWPKGQVIHRIHLKNYRSSEFNPGLMGNARFSPIKASDGASIPTLYGGTTFECAAMETVFHDVAFAAGLKTFDKQKLTDQVYSQVTPKRDLNLADLPAQRAHRHREGQIPGHAEMGRGHPRRVSYRRGVLLGVAAGRSRLGGHALRGSCCRNGSSRGQIRLRTDRGQFGQGPINWPASKRP